MNDSMWSAGEVGEEAAVEKADGISFVYWYIEEAIGFFFLSHSSSLHSDDDPKVYILLAAKAFSHVILPLLQLVDFSRNNNNLVLKQSRRKI